MAALQSGAVDGLLSALRAGSQEELTAAAKSGKILYLPNALARLAKKLTLSEATIQKQRDLADDVDLDNDEIDLS